MSPTEGLSWISRPACRGGVILLVGVLAVSCGAAGGQSPPPPLFQDVSPQALGSNASYREQLSLGIGDWAQRLDAASQIDFYGLNGLAAGDYDGDGWEDLYICQPGGLPNRLYRNQGDGTFEDVSAGSGVEILDSTSAALWADYDNDGRQDLFLLTTAGVLLFENRGGGRFRKSERARFEIAAAQQGVLTGGCLADYDRDGYLDLFVCQYSRAAGSIMAGALHHPTPYQDAANGAPNQLFRNNGDGTFSNLTAEAGLAPGNNRWSFAAAWADADQNGFPDLYVANDFGPNHFYLNRGDGTFEEAAGRAGIIDVGAGMSAAWADLDHDGRLDLYVGNIHSEEGRRIMDDPGFQASHPEGVRRALRRFSLGNSLYLNRGGGSFEDLSADSGTAPGGWAWSSDFLDADNDGWEDLYVVNGHVSNDSAEDLEAFHWREVAGSSPADERPSGPYEQAWRTFQRLMLEEGRSTHGRERNRFFLNRGQALFTDASALSGLDFPDDGRAFAAFDYDRDGDLDIVVKNRTAPQLRVLRNRLQGSPQAVVLELEGRRSNRDGVGTAVVIRTATGKRRREVRAGSGFLSQHGRRLHFGLGQASSLSEVTIEWPSGLVEQIPDIPAGGIYRIVEGSGSASLLSTFRPARPDPPLELSASPARPPEPGTWQLEPVALPGFRLVDPSGVPFSPLSRFAGRPLLLQLHPPGCRVCSEQPSFMAEEQASGVFLQAQAGPHLAGSYSISFENQQIISTVVKHLFVRRRSPQLPLGLLFDREGRLVWLLPGETRQEDVERLMGRMPASEGERRRLALPFPGVLYGSLGGRLESSFLIGLELLGRGLSEPALPFFTQAARLDPGIGEIQNNLAAAYAALGRPQEAIRHFRQAAGLAPGSSQVLFNLGTALAQAGRLEEAIVELQKAAELDPRSAPIRHNLGNAYLDLGRPESALAALQKALELDPLAGEIHNSLGTLYGQQGRWDEALRSFQEAVRLQPSLASGWLNLGLVYWRQEDTDQAAQMFRKVLALDPAHPAARQYLHELGAQP